MHRVFLEGDAHSSRKAQNVKGTKEDIGAARRLEVKQANSASREK